MIKKDDRIIEQEKIENMLKTQLMEIVNSDIVFYNNLKLKISHEQQYVREKVKEPNTIYIVYKLSPFALDYGQVIMPITLVAISEYNNINRCHRLLMDFSQAFNIDWDDTNTMKQFWESPQDVGNFEEIYDGFRSLFYVSGALIISKTANFCDLYVLNDDFSIKYNGQELDFSLLNKDLFNQKYFNEDIEEYVFEFKQSASPLTPWLSYWKYKDKQIAVGKELDIINTSSLNIKDGDVITISQKWENINYLTFSESTDIQVDSQVFQTTRNFAKSVGMSGINTLNISTYLLDEFFCNKCLAIKIKDLNKQPDGVDTKFYFKIKFKNGYELKDVYKLVGFAMSMQLKEIPTVSMTFTN